AGAFSIRCRPPRRCSSDHSGPATRPVPAGYPGAAFPYLANNLDYSRATLPNGLAVVANGGAPLPNTLTGSVVKDFNGEKVGIIGIVTPYLKSIADTGAIEVTTRDINGNV
ncbi:MAG: bifunctional metallophosphatase/5'-nucleotidase, partial [Microcystis panniformis]